MSTTLKNLTPNMMVEDVNRTIEFYKDVLSFEVVATVPEEGQFAWAMMKRDSVELMFQTRESLSAEIPAFEQRGLGGALTLYVDMEGVKEMYAYLKERVTFVQDMHVTFYGTQEFAIQDCNGFVLSFSGAIE